MSTVSTMSLTARSPVRSTSTMWRRTGSAMTSKGLRGMTMHMYINAYYAVKGLLHACSVLERCVPAAASLRDEIEHVIDGLQQIYAPFIHVVVKPRVRRVEVAQRAFGVTREDAQRRIL